MDCENYQLYFVWKWKFELMDYTKMEVRDERWPSD